MKPITIKYNDIHHSNVDEQGLREFISHQSFNYHLLAFDGYSVCYNGKEIIDNEIIRIFPDMYEKGYLFKKEKK